MPDMSAEVQQKTKAQISQGVGIAIMVAFGAAGAAALLLFGTSKKDTATTTTTTTTTTSTTTDLSTQTLPPKELLTTTSTTPTALDPRVSVVITSPKEGATANGGTMVTVELTDPNHVAAAVRVRLYSTVLPDYMQGTQIGSNIATPPYTFTPNLLMYPSGEYRYVAEAVKFDPSIPGADTAVVIATSDTMVTWVRTCYYLAYQDMTLTAPSTTITAGSSFTMTATVTNHQRGACQHKYILDTLDMNRLTSLLPDGWTATISPETENPLKSIYGLPFGIEETKTFSINVQVPATAATGDYQVGATSRLIYTGFIVTKRASVAVAAAADPGGSTGGDTGEIIPNR